MSFLDLSVGFWFGVSISSLYWSRRFRQRAQRIEALLREREALQ